MSRVIVTAPLIRAVRKVIVDGGGTGADAPARILRESLELDEDACAAAFGARAAGADVTFFALCEAAVEKALRARLEPQGVACRLRVVPAASAGMTRFESTDGAARLVVSESRLPELAEIDRLQDDLADDLLRAPAFVVVVGDLDGAKRPDYAERVVGRVWGLGLKSLIATSTPSLKQGYHTYPYGIVLRAQELRSICAMPRSPADETEAQTLERSFSESMRLFAIRTATDAVTLVTAQGRIELTTRASDAWIAGVLGAFAAADLAHPAEVARRAAESLSRVIPTGMTPVELERTAGK
ncbi:MAG: hypothetical protein IPH13_00665 [Planctomycetes bacterium]|nr:hypothetical protein [Planctomycetota bacterium]MCC7170587.1 hypothetical protein [Planctomycetota bacterium]